MPTNIEPAAYDLHQLKMLIVDDNQHMRVIERQILHAFGIRNIREAEDGASALKMMRVFEPDIALCDWNMTPLNGLEFTHMVRTSADIKNPFLPIIMLTGHTELHRVEEARDSGVDEFLAKPISAASLYARLVSVIENRRGFVRTTTYFGPDRRRHHHPRNYGGPERRQDSAKLGEGEALV